MKKYRFFNKICTEQEILDSVDARLAEIKGVGSRYQEIYNLIPNNSIVLDYGCGFGLFTAWVAEKSQYVDGIDLEENEIEVAKLITGTRKNITFSNARITDLDSAYYDTVISNQVAEHVHNVGNYLTQINRVLKNNGRLIISIPNVSSPRYFLPPLSRKFTKYLRRRSANILEEYDKPNSHINSWDAYHFTTLLASCGFKLENLVYCENVPLPPQFARFGLPSYWKTNSIFKSWSYTLVFEFHKERFVNIDALD